MTQPLRLVIEAAAPQSVVGLTRGAELVAERFNDVPKRHAEVLATNIDEVLAVGGASFRDVAEIVVGHGPGSFIGVRVALSTALGAGTALQCPVIGVCSVGALVQPASVPHTGTGLYVLDARKGELYVRAIAHGATKQSVFGPQAVPPGALASVLREHGIVPDRIVGAVHLVPDDIPGKRIACAGAQSLGVLWARLHDDQTQTRAPIVARYCRAPDARLPTLAPARLP